MPDEMEEVGEMPPQLRVVPPSEPGDASADNAAPAVADYNPPSMLLVVAAGALILLAVVVGMEILRRNIKKA